jgi:peptide methionine sulfoxide reductase MsrB
VEEKSAVGTVVGTVSGFDFSGANLTYALDNDAGGRFAINASTGVVTVASRIDYDAAHPSWTIAARISDGAHVAGQVFTINVIDIPNRAPVLTMAAGTIKADPGQSLQVSSWFSAGDADNDALTYWFLDSSPAANSGHFVLNGTPVAADTSFGLSAAQLAGLTFVAGAEGVADDVSMQLSDGTAASALGRLHIAVNHAPLLSVPANSITIDAGRSLQVSSLFGASDADNDALTYYFQDGNSPTSGHFVLNGAAITNGLNFSVTAAQLANLTYLAGTGGAASDDIWMQLSDGHAASALGQVHLNVVNHAPVLSVPASSIRMSEGQSLQVSTLFGAGDADNDALTYWFSDSSPAANSGHFVLNGTPVAANTSFGVSAAQLSQLSFVAGSAGSVDDLSIQLSDGYAASVLGQLHVNVNRAPVLSVPASSITINANQTVQVSTLFGASDPDNDALTYYFQNGNAPSSGHFVLNGAAIANGLNFNVSAAQLANLTYVAGKGDAASDDIWVQLSDGLAASALTGLVHLNVVNHAPVLTVPANNITTNPGQTLQVSGLFGATDPDNDALTYWFMDSSPAANSGHFVLNGTPVAANTSFGVSAAQLSQLSFVAGLAGSADELSMQLSDGTAASALGTLHLHAATPTPSDFNGDGRSDLLLLNDSTNGLYVCLMNGAVMGENALSFNISAAAGWHYQGLGDFDGDRKSDVLLLNYTSSGVYVCLMNGTHLGDNAQAFRIDSPNGWHFQTLGDFNGDGKSDVLLMNSITNGVYVCEMNGTELATNALAFNVQAADGWRFQDLGDFNGDGKSDILLSNDITHGLCVCEMDGTELGAHALSFNVSAAAGWHFQDLADFNGDGKTDILLMNDLTRGVYVCGMDGTQLAANGQAGTLADGWRFADTGDFNGDGKADLLLLNDATRGVMVWQMDGTQVAATAQVGTMLAGFHYIGQGDYNGDGKADLVFQNDATRDEQLWQMNGTSILNDAHIVTLSAGWHLAI